MNDFWTSELGEVTGESKDAFSKDFGTIPNGTMAAAKIDSFIVDEFNGVRFIHIKWELIEGDFKRRKVSQKLKVIDADSRDKDPEKTRLRGLNMLKLIYNLFNIKPNHNNIPSNDDLYIFVGKKAGIQIRETNPNKEGNIYNYVSEVHPYQGFTCETGNAVVVTHRVDSALSRNSNSRTDGVIHGIEDDIPF